MSRDKVNQDIFWLRDGSLEDNDNLPAPDVLAREIVEELRATLDQVMLEHECVLEDEWLANLEQSSFAILDISWKVIGSKW